MSPYVILHMNDSVFSSCLISCQSFYSKYILSPRGYVPKQRHEARFQTPWVNISYLVTFECILIGPGLYVSQSFGSTVKLAHQWQIGWYDALKSCAVLLCLIKTSVRFVSHTSAPRMTSSHKTFLSSRSGIFPVCFYMRFTAEIDF